MIGGNDDYGVPHVHLDDAVDSLGAPEPDEKVDDLWCLVAVHPGGGEGIYGQNMPAQVDGVVLMVQFIGGESMKQVFDQMLVDQGTWEVARRDGIRLEWRHYTRDE